MGFFNLLKKIYKVLETNILKCYVIGTLSIYIIN